MTEGRVLVLGGARSGKSAYAERLARESGLALVYLATARSTDAADDPEMAERIRHHRESRGADWRTVEAPEELEATLAGEAKEGRALVVDCLTLWLSNLMSAGADLAARSEALSRCVKALPGLVVFVSNEVGLGIVPATLLGRRFQDAQGRLNQAVAAACDDVVFMVAGLPLVLKGPKA